MRKLTLVVLALLASFSLSEKFTVSVAVNDHSTSLDYKRIGELQTEMIMGSLEVKMEEVDNALYNSLLRERAHPLLFKFQSKTGPSFISTIKLSPSASSFGIVAHTNTDMEIRAFNIVMKEEKSSLFAMNKLGRISFSTDTHHEEDTSFLSEEERRERERELKKRERQNIREERKKSKEMDQQQPFYKKYFWWLVIGGLIVWNISKFDKQKFSQQMKEMQEKQQGAAVRPSAR